MTDFWLLPFQALCGLRHCSLSIHASLPCITLEISRENLPAAFHSLLPPLYQGMLLHSCGQEMLFSASFCTHCVHSTGEIFIVEPSYSCCTGQHYRRLVRSCVGAHMRPRLASCMGLGSHQIQSMAALLQSWGCFYTQIRVSNPAVGRNCLGERLLSGSSSESRAINWLFNWGLPLCTIGSGTLWVVGYSGATHCVKTYLVTGHNIMSIMLFSPWHAALLWRNIPSLLKLTSVKLVYPYMLHLCLLSPTKFAHWACLIAVSTTLAHVDARLTIKNGVAVTLNWLFLEFLLQGFSSTSHPVVWNV